VQLEAAYQALDAVQQWEGAAEQNNATLQAARAALFAALPGLAEAAGGETLTRIHGDLHLGQVLVASGEVYFIDFEGEPAKPVELRRSKDHPLRDVAGMLRSFDYAAAVVRRRSQSSHAHLPAEMIGGFLDKFMERASESFLAGYRAAVASAETDVSSARLLDLFLIEKAAYEVVYEAANRPGWIDVPLLGLARCARRVLALEDAA
jgi:maltose alpha-D-glucosyltransferase/alpha-amylase